MSKWHLIVDVAGCTNCQVCVLACHDEHVGNTFPGYAEEMPKHGHKWIEIKAKERGTSPMMDIAFLPVMCQHCDDAPCMAAAKDGAEQVRIEFAPLPSVTATAAALEPGAPVVWDDAPDNLCVDADVGERAAAEAAFAGAMHVVRFETWIRRVTGMPMEPRAAIGNYDPKTGRYTVYAGSGGAVRQKHEAAAILGVKLDAVRFVAGDVGGNFGTRNAFYPEFALVAWAARRVGRPVKWTCERREAFLSDHQGRDLAVEAELALDAEGYFLGLRGSVLRYSNLPQIDQHC